MPVCFASPIIEYIEAYTTFTPEVSESMRSLLQETQTSGGLLVLVHPDQACAACDALRQGGNTQTEIIGTVASLVDAPQQAPIYLQVTT